MLDCVAFIKYFILCIIKFYILFWFLLELGTAGMHLPCTMICQILLLIIFTTYMAVCMGTLLHHLPHVSIPVPLCIQL